MRYCLNILKTAEKAGNKKSNRPEAVGDLYRTHFENRSSPLPVLCDTAKKKAAATSLPQLFGGSWWIRKPRSKKQSAGLFFAVCGRPTCSNPTSSSTKKNPQPKLRVLFVSTLQKGCPLNQPFVCTPTSCSHGIFPVFRHGLSPPKYGWQ